MTASKGIIDSYDHQDDVNKRKETRFVRVVRVVVGCILTLLGGAFLFGIAYDLFKVIQYTSSTQYTYLPTFSWGNWLVGKMLSFLYTFCFLMGGVGLLRKSNKGWAFAITISLFTVLQIGFMVYWIESTVVDGNLGPFGWVLFGVALFFGVIVFLLMSKSVRSFFKLTSGSFWIAGVTFVALTLSFVANMFLLR